jgi:3-phenylpropionate/trans-cinnamate dioxygenase ferredoxin subunit
MTTRERVMALEDLAPGTAKQVQVGEHVIALVRIDDDVYALGDRCSHQDISLSEGDVIVEDRALECWTHGSAFSLVDGEPLSLPATRPVPVYEVQVVDGQIEVIVDG